MLRVKASDCAIDLRRVYLIIRLDDRGVACARLFFTKGIELLVEYASLHERELMIARWTNVPTRV